MTDYREQISPVSAHVLLPYDPAGYGDPDGYLVECPKCLAMVRKVNADLHAERCPAKTLDQLAPD